MKRIISWSGGKDSTATVILAKEHGIKIDAILFSEVMFDENISGKLPEHIEFIKNKAIPTFESWGYKTEILHHDKTYMDYFNQVRVRGKNVGKKVGFPMADKCNVRNCKVRPIEKYIKQLDEDIIQYVGITSDEKVRLNRLNNTEKLSLLAEYGYTKDMARQLCADYDLLSPYYRTSQRGGCWFCPNSRKCQLKHLRDNYRELWDKLMSLEEHNNLIGTIWNTQNGTSIHKMDSILEQESRQVTIADYLSSIQNKEGKIKYERK